MCSAHNAHNAHFSSFFVSQARELEFDMQAMAFFLFLVLSRQKLSQFSEQDTLDRSRFAFHVGHLCYNILSRKTVIKLDILSNDGCIYFFVSK